MSKPVIQFSHANGFPGGCYRYLFQQLPEYEICYVEKLGHGDYPLDGDLKNYALELIGDIRTHGQYPVIGIGHSAGAVVTLLAAALEPELFHEVILLDPVIFSKRKRYALKLASALGGLDKITPAGRAAKRKACFSSRAEAESYFSQKALFQDFHPECFQDYLRFGLTDAGEGVELSISPDIEADVFRNVLLDVPDWIKQVKGQVIFGRSSHLLNKPDLRWWQKNFPAMKLIGVEGGHLFPFESPVETANLLQMMLQKNQTAV